MHYVYVLQSEKDNDLYVGCTNDLKERIKLHNAKKVKSTSSRTPFKIIHYEAYLNNKDAFNREKYMKNKWGRKYIKKLLSNFFISNNLSG